MTNSIPIIDRVVDHYVSAWGRIRGLQPADLEDLRQEGYLAVIEALATWDKCKGALSTYLSPHVHGAMSLWLSREGKHGMTGLAHIPEFIELEPDTDELEGLAEDTPENGLLSDQILSVVDDLPALQRALLSEYYGLWDRKPLTLRELAAKRRVSLAVMRTRVDNALRMANKLLLDRGVRIHDV